MTRLRLMDMRATTMPQSIGICADDVGAISAAVNEAQEFLLHDPFTPEEGWWGGWVKMLFNATVTRSHTYIVTPQEIARLILIDVCKHPVRIRNGFYEYLEFGTGLQPRGCRRDCGTISQGYERDNVATLSDLQPTPQTIRIYVSDPRDVGKKILLQGADSNGVPVLGTDITTGKAILGEYVYFTQPFTDSVNQFSTITGIQKDTTFGPVTIMQVDPTSGAALPLSSMEPQEQTASYRRYLVNGLPSKCCNTTQGTVQISAQAKLDYIPAVSDPDYLIIQSRPALIEECQARRYSKIDNELSQQLAVQHHTNAIRLLNGQLDAYEGKTNPSIRVPLFGSDRLRPQPI